MIAYILNSVLWGMAGFILGVALGGMVADVHDIRRALTKDPPPPRRRGITRQRLFGMVLVTASVLSMGTVAVHVHNLNRIIDCQAGFNSAFAEAIEVRNRVSKQQLREERALWEEVSQAVRHGQGVEPLLAALDRHIAVLDSGINEREATPLPTRRCL